MTLHQILYKQQRRKRMQKPRSCCCLYLWLLLLVVVLRTGRAANNNNNYNYNGQFYGNNNGNDDGGGNDDDGAGNDDGAKDDDDNAAYDAAAYDDDYYGYNQQGGNDDGNNNIWRNYNDDIANQNKYADDDMFHWNSNVGFAGVSIMPLSCVNYNNGQMIKFDFFDAQQSYQCHFGEIGTFVVSIAHYMRAYFNYQALVQGQDFSLPGDAGYLDCILVQETAYSDTPLYAKIGCMERDSFTSTKLALHLYTDAQCATPYEDGQSTRYHSTKGYMVNGYLFSSRVTFRPPFYTCSTCAPRDISNTFNKATQGMWYDDDYYAQKQQQQQNNNQNQNNNNQNQGNNDDGNYYQDDYAGDDLYNQGDDDRRRLRTQEEEQETARSLTPAPGQLEKFEQDFWAEVHAIREQARTLYDNNYNIGDWNMCQRVYKYGVWCDEECRQLDLFRTNRWSGADIILLTIICTFIAAMMLLIVAKRLRATQKARYYGGGETATIMPGLPPVAMAVLFGVIMLLIVALAKLKFVNETLVFAVITCILIFIYLLKLTLFDKRRPVLLAAPKHFGDFDTNPLEDKLFD